MLICYIIELIVACFVLYVCILALIGFAREKRKKQENDQIQALTSRENSFLLPLLRGEFRAIKMANPRAHVDLLNLSTVIQKLSRGERVERSTIIFLLSRMQGTEELIEKIKREGA